jgi:SAM-dependent methyltransferase
MIRQIKNAFRKKIEQIAQKAVRDQIRFLVPQYLQFQTAPKNQRISSYVMADLPNLDSRYTSIRDKMGSLVVTVGDSHIDISAFRRWMHDFPQVIEAYEWMGATKIEKCLEHYLSYSLLGLKPGTTYLDVAAAGSKWVEILRKRGIVGFRLDLGYPKGIHGINIGADAAHTGLPGDSYDSLSAQCAYECFMGDADNGFLQEGARLLKPGGRLAIVPLYVEYVHVIAVSPFNDNQKLEIDQGAMAAWRDDEWPVPFSRTYSPEAFAQRVYSTLPSSLNAKVLYFANLDQVRNEFPGSKMYCRFMFLCEKKAI